jgi:hypothetical protein
VGLDDDAEGGQAGGDLGVLALVEGAVGALHGVAAGSHEPGQGVHPGPRDAGEVVAHTSSCHE